jgi:hypothetical protein
LFDQNKNPRLAIPRMLAGGARVGSHSNTSVNDEHFQGTPSHDIPHAPAQKIVDPGQLTQIGQIMFLFLRHLRG